MSNGILRAQEAHGILSLQLFLNFVESTTGEFLCVLSSCRCSRRSKMSALRETWVSGPGWGFLSGSLFQELRVGLVLSSIFLPPSCPSCSPFPHPGWGMRERNWQTSPLLGSWPAFGAGAVGKGGLIWLECWPCLHLLGDLGQVSFFFFGLLRC